MPLPFKVTTAGRAALVNAGNTGTLPVTVAQVGVTATAFTAAADGSDLALPGELKRLATFGGAAVADDTIHAVIRDDSADVYTLRGFALYLADGTLFGLYGQADPILEKSAAAMMLLASDIIFADIDAASLVFGDTSFLNPPATIDTAGVVELATDAEAIAGEDGTRAVTPKGLLAKLNALLGAGAPSAFVKSLLTAIDLVAFRSALAIKTAASYDIGVGNGLDADLLDGQHGAYYRAWGNLTGVPDTLTPSAHQHSAADITSGLLPVARGGTGAGTFAAGSYLIGNGTSAFAVKTPAQVLSDIGAAPVLHSHAISAVNGLQTELDVRPIQTSVTAQISAAINGLINGSPGALDTLKELATAMGNDANFSATVMNILAGKASVAGQDFTGPISSPRLTTPQITTPTTQGFEIFWNVASPGAGANEYVNNFGQGSGGHYFYVRSGTSGAITEVGHISGSGLLTAPGGLTTGGAVTSYQTFQAAGPAAVMQPTGSGACVLRPNQNSTIGQLAVNSDGSVSVTSLSASGGVACLTMNASGSDIRLKTDVEPAAPRPLHRLLAALPNTHGPLTTYIHRVDGAQRRGPIAQDMERIEPAYMGSIEITAGQVEGVAAGTYKTVDKASAAYEQAMWAGQEVDRLRTLVEALTARLAGTGLR